MYLNGQRLTVQNNSNTNTAQYVWWIYESPATGSTRGTSTKMAGEADPLGVNAGTTAPAQAPPDNGDYVSDLIIPRQDASSFVMANL